MSTPRGALQEACYDSKRIDSDRALRRVVRGGGTVTAAVWDHYGGTPHYGMLVDIAATLDPAVERKLFLPLTGPDEMATLWRPAGRLVASLSAATRATLQDHMRCAYIANRPDGPRSFACVAWACRGTVSP